MKTNQTTTRINLDSLPDNVKPAYLDNDLIIIDDFKDFYMQESVQLDMIVVLICTEGRLEADINGRTFKARANDMVVCPPNVFIDNYMMSPDFNSKIIGLSYGALQRLLHVNKDIWDMLLLLPDHPVFHLDEEQQSLLKSYYTILGHKLEHSLTNYRSEVMQALFQAVFYEVCATIAPHLRPDESAGNVRMKQGDLLMKKFIRLLADSRGRERSVAYYAEQLCVTPKYLSMSCKASSGKTALEWIHEYTTEVITQQLKYSDRTIKEISDDLGFSTISFFGKFVKAHLGASPTAYRRRLAETGR